VQRATDIYTPSEYASIARKRVEVRNCAEMRAALNDTSVDHVMLMNDGHFNCTLEDMPPNGVIIVNRTVLWEGEGPGMAYIDVSVVHRCG